ncbi:MAG: amidohydrolase [Proteobacteria bacterium]|nr:amidohydrolase [Pseudomonadota bacterium]
MRVKTLLARSVVILVTAIAPGFGVADTLNQTIAERVAAVNDKVVAWRRDIHANPELSNREFRTSALVAEHLRSLGIKVQTGVAHTGVIGLLKGGKPGPVIALRADMDALPVVEKTGLAFASTVRGEYQGRDVGVMHACGHDTHVAILMGAAEVLAAVRDELPGTVKFLFQPAEEGTPKGENGGAKMMIEEGALLNPRVDAVVGLPISQGDVVGRASFRPLGLMASAQRFDVEITGSQTHGARPWAGVDPIVAGAQIVNALQTITSRQIDITQHPVVVTVGQFEAGVRNNIVPETARLSGTIRTFDPDVRGQVHDKIKRIVTQVAASQGATATVDIDPGVPVTYNHAGLTSQLQGTLAAVYGKDNLLVPPPITGAEDFSFFQEQVPGFFFFIGGRPADVPVSEAIPNHSPYCYVDEGALPLGVHAMSRLAADYLRAGGR